MVEKYVSRIDELKERLEAWSSSQKKVENNDSNNPIDEINASHNPLDTTLKMIDEGKDLSYIMKSLNEIDFSGGNLYKKDGFSSDYKEDSILKNRINLDAKMKIALKVFSKDWWWKHVLDNWKNLIDLTSEDKKVVINNFKLLVDSAYRKPDELKANESWMNVNTSHLDKNLLEQKVWKDDYYDYLENNSLFKSVLQNDREASILFGNILTEKIKFEDDKFEEQFSEAYWDNWNGDLDWGNDSDWTDDGSEWGNRDLHWSYDDSDWSDDGPKWDGDWGWDNADELHGYDPNLNIAWNVDPKHFENNYDLPDSLVDKLNDLEDKYDI